LFPIWGLAITVIFLGPLKLLGISTVQPFPEFPFWLAILLLIVAIVGGMVIALPLANRIASRFLSKDTMIKIVNKNIFPYFPLYGLIMRDIDRIYGKKDA
jgi:uncharacterized membrane protein YphA (DoxX/SURF4 family)